MIETVPVDRVASAALDAEAISVWGAGLSSVDRDVTDAVRIDQLRALEDLKAMASAAQAQISVDFDASQRAAQADAGVLAAQRGRGVGAQIALARRESPAHGSRHLGLAKALMHEMPHTRAALQRGTLSEWRATLLVRETACLSIKDRQTVDRRIAGDAAGLERLGDGQLISEAKKLVCRLDPASVVRRNRRAVSERRVTCRPAPDTMALVNGLLPVAQGVAVMAALTQAADRRISVGDERTRSQIMADTLVERVTGQTTAGAVPIEVQLVVSDQTLLGGGNDPAHLPAHGPIPPVIARELVARAAAADAAWVRRLYSCPGALVAMDSHRRCFPAGLARFIGVRDDTCRTQWCDAPIRHLDHAVPHDDGGPTSAANGQGLCEQCNYTKQAPDWHARPGPGPTTAIDVTTPTGHTYTSTAPRPPRAASPPGTSVMEIRLTEFLLGV